jgi:hypothetical protein
LLELLVGLVANKTKFFCWSFWWGWWLTKQNSFVGASGGAGG